jgi:uncharacterized protein YndB with AHSA1/START domain
MGTEDQRKPAPDEVSLRIEAPAEQLWDMVADVTRMGEWSPECYKCRWTGRERNPVEGAKFLGMNKRGWKHWATPNVVVEAERGKVFAFKTVGNNNVWGYRFEPDGDATVVTEFRQLPAKRPWYALAALQFLGGAQRYDAGVPDGMRQTLDRLKTVAESDSATD